jgi:hypothetical protein
METSLAQAVKTLHCYHHVIIETAAPMYFLRQRSVCGFFVLVLDLFSGRATFSP